MEDRKRNLKGVIVSTADSYRGNENDIIIFNPVVTERRRRDGKLGFLG